MNLDHPIRGLGHLDRLDQKNSLLRVGHLQDCALSGDRWDRNDRRDRVAR